MLLRDSGQPGGSAGPHYVATQFGIVLPFSGLFYIVLFYSLRVIC